MKRLFTLSCLCLCSLLLLACTEENKPEQSPDIKERLVKVMLVKHVDFVKQRSYPGTVVASRKVDLAFQVTGKLINFPVKEGQLVQQEELLAQLDQRDFMHDYEARTAELVKAKQDVTRAEKLLSSGTIPESKYDEAKRNFDVALSNQKTAQKALDDASLRAPFSGIVANTYVENYQNIQAKEQILSLQDISSVDIEINLPEKDMAEARSIKDIQTKDLNRPVNGYVTFEAIPAQQYQVRIKEYATQADPITQTYKITLTMPAPKDVNVLPGMTASFVLNTKSNAKAQRFYIPVSAVGTDPQGRYYVWIVDAKTMTVNKRIIEVANMLDDKIIVTNGVNDNETIVAAGAAYLEDKMKIRIMQSHQ